jgi:hypothetical protein
VRMAELQMKFETLARVDCCGVDPSLCLHTMLKHGLLFCFVLFFSF